VEVVFVFAAAAVAVSLAGSRLKKFHNNKRPLEARAGGGARAAGRQNNAIKRHRQAASLDTLRRVRR
jgi:hypothetical protein